MNCKNHQDKNAIYQCDNCKNYFCDTCTIIRKISDEFTAYICKECGGKCDPIVKSAAPQKPAKAKLFGTDSTTEIKIKDQAAVKNVSEKIIKLKPQSFWRSLPDIFVFPLRGKGVLIILLMAALFCGLSELNHISAVAGLCVSVVFIGYFSIYFLKVIEDSFHGSTRLEDLPNPQYWTDRTKLMLYTFFALVLYLLPSQVYFLQFQNFDVIYFVLLGVGSFLLPMVLVHIIIFQKLRQISPGLITLSILKTFFAYLIVYILMTGFKFLLLYLNNEYFVDYEKIGYVVSQLLMVYFMFVQGRLLGIFAKFFKERIAGIKKGEST